MPERAEEERIVQLHIEDGKCRKCNRDTDVNDDGLCFACFVKGRHAWLR
jgi:hypothetical protein